MVNPLLVPVRPGGVLTCELNGHPATIDVTDQLPLQAVIPAMTVPSPLIPGDALQYAVVRSTGEQDVHGDLANAMIDAFPAPERGRATHYRFVSLTPGDFMCGISTPELFQGGWGFRGVFLNSSNGGLVGRGLLRSDYCPSFSKQGSVVDWIMEVDRHTVTVYILRDGHPCGPAFILNMMGREEMISRIRPAVSFAGVGMDVAIVLFHPANPSSAYRERSDTPIDPRNQAFGKWMSDPQEWPGVAFPEPLTIDITEHGVHTRVINILNLAAQFKPDGTLTTGATITTRMLAMPPFDQTERVVGQFLDSLSGWKITNEGILLLASAQGQKSFRRFTASVPPVTENPLIE